MNAKELIKKRNITLIIFLFVVAFFIGILVMISKLFPDYRDMSLWLLIALVVMIVVLLWFRRTLYSYNNLARIAQTILKQGEAVPYTKNPVKDDIYLKNAGYVLFSQNNDFKLLYSLDRDESYKSKKVYLLYLIIIIKNSSLDFYDKSIHEEIYKLESGFDKKKKPTRYLISAFKEFDEIDETALRSIGEVVNYKQYRQHFTQINVGLNINEHKAYFLYSKEYNPSRNYSQTIEFIQKIIQKKV
mgnify:CR=1 FL=1